MIGFSKNTYLIACNSYLYLFSLYGRTVLDHIRCGGRGMRHILRGVYDALRNVGRVYDRPLCACPACVKQAQAEDCQNFYSHFLSLDLVVIIGFIVCLPRCLLREWPLYSPRSARRSGCPFPHCTPHLCGIRYS